MTRFAAFLTTILFLISNTAYGYTPAEKMMPVQIGIQIPEQLGKIDTISIKENSPLILHIQSAHGNYEAQKNIQAILDYLSKNYGFDLLLLEGGVGKLNPQLFNLFPEKPELNVRVADTMMKKAELTGAEAFLIEKMSQGEDQRINAYGIENAELYREDRKAFQKVIRQKEKSDAFLNKLGQEINKLTTKTVNSELRDFLKESDLYEGKQIEPFVFFRLLKKEASKNLNIDLSDANLQNQWPMLTRLFKLDNLKNKIILPKAEEERRAFLTKLKSLGIKFEIPPKGIRLAFEKLFEILPADYPFKPYENFQLLIQSQILEEELDSTQLFQETEQIKQRIVNVMAATKAEKEAVLLLENFKLAQKLFALTLTREEFQKLTEKQREIKTLVQNINDLYETAVQFYIGAGKREDVMFQNAVSRMQRLGKKRSIIVTGGFHSEGMEQFAKSKDFSYVRVSPTISSTQGSRDYMLAMLEEHSRSIQKSQIEAIIKLQSESNFQQEGGNTEYLRCQINEATAASLGAINNNPDSNSTSYVSALNETIQILKLITLPGNNVEKFYFLKNNSRYLCIVSADGSAKLFDLFSIKELLLPSLESQQKFVSVETNSDGSLIFLFYYTTETSTDGDGFTSERYTYHVKTLNPSNGTENSYVMGSLVSMRHSYTLPDGSYTCTKEMNRVDSPFIVTFGSTKPVLPIPPDNNQQTNDKYAFVGSTEKKPAHLLDKEQKNETTLKGAENASFGIFSSNFKYVIALMGKCKTKFIQSVEKGIRQTRSVIDNSERSMKAFDTANTTDTGIVFGPNIDDAKFLPSGNLLVVSYSVLNGNDSVRSAKLFDLQTKQNLQFIIGPEAIKIESSKDGKHIVVQYKDKTLKIFDVKSMIANSILRKLIQIWGANSFAGFTLLSLLIKEKLIDTKDRFDLFIQLFTALLTGNSSGIDVKKARNFPIWRQVYTDLKSKNYSLPITQEDFEKIKTYFSPGANGKSLGSRVVDNQIVRVVNSENPRPSKLILFLKTIASIATISAMAALIYGSPLKSVLVSHLGIDLTNILFFGYFTVMNDFLGQWLSGRGIVKKQVAWALPLGLVLGVVTWAGFKATNWAVPKNADMPILLADILRVLGVWIMIRLRTMLYAKMVNLVRGNGKSKEEQEKQFESFWMTRSLSFVKNYSVLKFIPPEYQTVAEGILNQYFQLFYSWSVNKSGFIFSSEKLRTSRLFLSFFPVTAPIWWFTNRLRSTVPVVPSEEIRGSSLGAEGFLDEAQSYIDFISMAHQVEAQAAKPDVFLALGNPDIHSFIAFSILWKTLAKEGSHAKIPVVISGGRGRGTPGLIWRVLNFYRNQLTLTQQEALSRPDITEAEVIRWILIHEGIHPDYIFLEKKSTNTPENFEFSLPVIRSAVSEKRPQNINVQIITNPALNLRAYQTGLKKWEDAIKSDNWRITAKPVYPLNVKNISAPEFNELLGFVLGFPNDFKRHEPVNRKSEIERIIEYSSKPNPDVEPIDFSKTSWNVERVARLREALLKSAPAVQAQSLGGNPALLSRLQELMLQSHNPRLIEELGRLASYEFHIVSDSDQKPLTEIKVDGQKILIGETVLENLPVNSLAQIIFRRIQKQLGIVEQADSQLDIQQKHLLEEEVEYALTGKAELKESVREVKKVQDKLLARAFENLDPSKPIFAIIGAGIAGATVIGDIKKQNPQAQFVVFDSNPLIGGKILYAIPAFRAHIKETYLTGKAGIATILNQEGIYLLPNFEIGRDISFANFAQLPFDGVFFAGGNPVPKIDKNIEGLEGPDVYVSTDIYRPYNVRELDLPEAKKYEDVEKLVGEKTVVIIGGGNVSLDVARISLEKGAKQVILLYQRGYDVFAKYFDPESRSPQTGPEERNGAEAVGLQYETMTRVRKIIREESGKITGIEVQRLAYDNPAQPLEKLKKTKLIPARDASGKEIIWTIPSDLIVFSIADDLASPLERKFLPLAANDKWPANADVSLRLLESQTGWIAAGDSATAGGKAGASRTSANKAAKRINASGVKTSDERSRLILQLASIQKAHLSSSAASLGRKPFPNIEQDPDFSKLKAYSQSHGRVHPRFILATARVLAGDFLFIPEAPDVLTSYLRILTGSKKSIKANPSIEAFNRGQNFSAFLKSSKIGEVDRPLPLIVHEQIFQQSTARDAKIISENLKRGDLLIAATTSLKSPRLISELHKLSKGQFKVRTIHEKILSRTKIAEMTRGFENTPVAVTTLNNLFEPDLARGDKVKLDLQVLLDNGVDPIQVIALIRKLADYPELRGRLFSEAGFRFVKGQGFWEVGNSFIAHLASIYSEHSARQAALRAA